MILSKNMFNPPRIRDGCGIVSRESSNMKTSGNMEESSSGWSTTSDAPNSKSKISLNLSDEEISTDHQIIECPVKCHVSRNGYYHRKGLVMNRQDDFKKLLSDKLAQGESEFVFKLPSAKDADKVVQKIMDNVNEVLGSKRHGFKKYQISPNPTQLVYKLKLW